MDEFQSITHARKIPCDFEKMDGEKCAIAFSASVFVFVCIEQYDFFRGSQFGNPAAEEVIGAMRHFSLVRQNVLCGLVFAAFVGAFYAKQVGISSVEHDIAGSVCRYSAAGFKPGDQAKA